MEEYIKKRLLVQVDYFDENGLFSSQHQCHVPCIGDEVRFNRTSYEIILRMWIEDEENKRVALHMKKLPKKNQPPN